jgi:hypothetical protein
LGKFKNLSSTSSLIYFSTLPMSIAWMLFMMAIYSHSHFHCSIKGERRRTECYITSVTSEGSCLADRQHQIVIFDFHAVAQEEESFANYYGSVTNYHRFSICVNILDFCRIGFLFIRLSKDTENKAIIMIVSLERMRRFFCANFRPRFSLLSLPSASYFDGTVCVFMCCANENKTPWRRHDKKDPVAQANKGKFYSGTENFYEKTLRSRKNE